MGRTLKALAGIGRGSADDLFLTVFGEGVDGGVRAGIIGQRIINRQGEEGYILGERLLDLSRSLP